MIFIDALRLCPAHAPHGMAEQGKTSDWLYLIVLGIRWEVSPVQICYCGRIRCLLSLKRLTSCLRHLHYRASPQSAARPHPNHFAPISHLYPNFKISISIVFKDCLRLPGSRRNRCAGQGRITARRLNLHGPIYPQL
ncbi:hypothetical protein CEXT_541551 [Caerostris extrusa]|uniref:Uncharacterized protein n=1 Tax=Caerostris extrusa TaxID=172846 RepID=A0AAV4UP54_CAEEX|nr:hypothetical protein CEXT_541551 [Caerostris extrusa]